MPCDADPAMASLRMNQFYKTKTCPWYFKGRCERGDSCRFAHNEREKRELPDLSRTSFCPMLLKHGICQSSHCRFAHNVDQLRATDDMYKTSLCFMFMKSRCEAGSQCRHAHGTHELRAVPPSAERAEEFLHGAPLSDPPFKHDGKKMARGKQNSASLTNSFKSILGPQAVPVVAVGGSGDRFSSPIPSYVTPAPYYMYPQLSPKIAHEVPNGSRPPKQQNPGWNQEEGRDQYPQDQETWNTIAAAFSFLNQSDGNPDPTPDPQQLSQWLSSVRSGWPLDYSSISTETSTLETAERRSYKNPAHVGNRLQVGTATNSRPANSRPENSAEPAVEDNQVHRKVKEESGYGRYRNGMANKKTARLNGPSRRYSTQSGYQMPPLPQDRRAVSLEGSAHQLSSHPSVELEEQNSERLSFSSFNSSPLFLPLSPPANPAEPQIPNVSTQPRSMSNQPLSTQTLSSQIESLFPRSPKQFPGLQETSATFPQSRRRFDSTTDQNLLSSDSQSVENLVDWLHLSQDQQILDGTDCYSLPSEGKCLTQEQLDCGLTTAATTTTTTPTAARGDSVEHITGRIANMNFHGSIDPVKLAATLLAKPSISWKSEESIHSVDEHHIRRHSIAETPDRRLDSHMDDPNLVELLSQINAVQSSVQSSVQTGGFWDRHGSPTQTGFGCSSYASPQTASALWLDGTAAAVATASPAEFWAATALPSTIPATPERSNVLKWPGLGEPRVGEPRMV